MPKPRPPEPRAPTLARALRNARASLASNLREQRAAAGISQATLAERAELSHVYITSLEGLDHENPTLTALASIAFALGCPLAALLAEAPMPNRRSPGRPPSNSRSESKVSRKPRAAGRSR